MAENPNSSETPSNNPATRQRTDLSTLSRIFKTQTSSIQHRACPQMKSKPARSFKMFLIKSLIAGGAIYYTAFLGVWGGSEETNRLYTRMRQSICPVDNEKLISSKLKTDMIDKIIKSKDFLKGHLEGIPEELKVYYDKSEKYINELIKGKKF